MTQEEAIKAVDRIFNYCEEIDCHLPKEEQTGYEMLLDINAVIEYILDNPKVVRCEDCCFYDKKNSGGLVGHGLCEIYRKFKTKDGYCDYGERRETK